MTVFRLVCLYGRLPEIHMNINNLNKRDIQFIECCLTDFLKDTEGVFATRVESLLTNISKNKNRFWGFTGADKDLLLHVLRHVKAGIKENVLLSRITELQRIISTL